MGRGSGTTIAAPNILFTADADQLTQEVRQTKEEVKQAARAFEAGFAKGADKAERAMRRTGTAARGIGKDFKGAGTAISGATASLQLLGQQGPPAIQTLSASVSSLVESGFGPLGLAVAGATAAITFLVKSVGDYQTWMKEAERQTDRVSVRLKELRQARDAAVAGRTLGEQQYLEDLGAQEKLLDAQRSLVKGLERDLEEAQAARDRLLQSDRPDPRELGDAGQRIRDLQLEIELEQRSERILSDNVENLQLAERYREETLAAQKDAVRAAQDEHRALYGSVTQSRALQESTENRVRTWRDFMDEWQRGTPGGLRSIDPTPSGDDGRRSLPEKGEIEDRTSALEDLLEIEEQVNREFPIGPRLKQDVEEVSEEVKKVEEGVLAAGHAFAGSLGSGIADAVLEAKNLRDVLREIFATVARSFIQTSVTAFTGNALGLDKMPSKVMVPAGGFGSTDASIAGVGAKASTYLPSSSGGGGVSVHIHNHTSAAVSARETQGPSGPQIDVMIEQIVSSDLERGGPISRTLARTHGARRRGRRG